MELTLFRVLLNKTFAADVIDAGKFFSRRSSIDDPFFAGKTQNQKASTGTCVGERVTAIYWTPI